LKTIRALFLLVCFLAGRMAFAKQPVLVISVDGLDQRYFSDADKLGVKIPHFRKLMREGQSSAGVVGVVPTVTWPSHTTIITGVDPTQHGILGNQRPAKEGGDYYWTADLLKTSTLLDAAHQAGLKTASITWPVTVGAPSDYNLPEYFKKRRGGAMDLRSISSKANPPDLPHRIAAMFPSFRQEWMDDRTRTLATRYLLKTEHPDFMIVHLVDLDSEAHDNAPFTPEALAILEYTDELIGTIIEDLPANYAFVLVSDHGFEKVDRQVNLNVIAKQKNIEGVRPMGGIVVADNTVAAQFLQDLRKDSQHGIGRAIPKEELQRFSPDLAKAAAVFESATGIWFGPASTGELFTEPREKGTHGHWPTRYRAVFLAYGQGIPAQRLPEMSMKDIAQRLAGLLGVTFRPVPKP